MIEVLPRSEIKNRHFQAELIRGFPEPQRERTNRNVSMSIEISDLVFCQRTPHT